MKGLVVERQEHTNESTISSVYFNGDFVCYMLERPWANNAPFISCISAGTYDLVPHKYKGRVDTFALVGNGVTHYEEAESVRYLILIHSANYPSELHGCLAPGTGKAENVVMNSRTALKQLIKTITDNDVKSITII